MIGIKSNQFKSKAKSLEIMFKQFDDISIPVTMSTISSVDWRGGNYNTKKKKNNNNIDDNQRQTNALTGLSVQPGGRRSRQNPVPTSRHRSQSNSSAHQRRSAAHDGNAGSAGLGRFPAAGQPQ